MPRAVNEMVQQLTTLANEVTRVSLEVGTEGKLGGQVRAPRRTSPPSSPLLTGADPRRSL